MSRVAHRMTPARKAALRKAQLASAKKRRRRNRAIAGGVAVGVLGAGVARHKYSGSTLTVRRTSGRSTVTGERLPGGKKGYVRVGKGLDAKKRPYRQLTIAGPSAKRGTVKIIAGHAVGPRKQNWGKRVMVEYQHKALFGQKTKSLKPKIDKDAIPYYNPNAKKPWPHVDAATARENNAKIHSSMAATKKRWRRK